jgi:hypothetical protein
VHESSMLSMKRRFANVLVNMMSLPVFLLHEEGRTDKFQGINDRHRR